MPEISPYILIFILVLFATLLSRSVPKLNEPLYVICFMAMTAFLALRYGQGTDYSMYEYYYLAAPNSIDFGSLYFTDLYHTETGWKVVMMLLRTCNVPFEAFIAVLSLAMMACLSRCIRLFSPARMLSLLIAFPTLYLTGFFSMLREGFVVAIFLGFLLQLLLEDRKPVVYICTSLALSFIHSVALILIAVYVIARFIDHSKDRNWLWLLLGVFLLAGILPLASEGLRSFLSTLPGIGYYYRDVQVSWLAFGERVLWFAVIVPMGYRIASGAPKDSIIQSNLLPRLLDLYVIGFALYCLFLPSPITASRFFFPFESLELLLVPLVFSFTVKWRSVVLLLVIALSVLFVIKNLDAYLGERGYYDFVSWVSYPYVSIFDDHEQLSLYREPYKLSGMP